MATKIKTNTLESQIDFIDSAVALATGIDLRKRAQDAINRRNAYRELGHKIASGLGVFVDGQAVAVSEIKMETIY